MKYAIITTYSVSAVNDIDLGDKTWDDVEDWYIRWVTLHVRFKGSDKFEEFDLPSEAEGDTIDWKRPAETQVFEFDEDGDVDWDKEISSQSD